MRIPIPMLVFNLEILCFKGKFMQSFNYRIWIFEYQSTMLVFNLRTAASQLNWPVKQFVKPPKPCGTPHKDANNQPWAEQLMWVLVAWELLTTLMIGWRGCWWKNTMVGAAFIWLVVKIKYKIKAINKITIKE